MAKIYETKEDFQRDVLEAQAKDLRLKSERQASSGLGLIGISFAPSVFKLPSWLNIAASIAGIVGVIDVVRSWFTGSKAHTLELQRERLGPGQVALPADTASPVVLMPSEKSIDCGCKHKKIAEAFKPKTLSDFAEKPSADAVLLQQR